MRRLVVGLHFLDTYLTEDPVVFKMASNAEPGEEEVALFCDITSLSWQEATARLKVSADLGGRLDVWNSVR